MTLGSSAHSSQALVPVVTVLSSRASAWVRTIVRSDTRSPREYGGWGADRIQTPRATSPASPAASHAPLFPHAVSTSPPPDGEPPAPSRRSSHVGRPRRRRGRVVALVLLLVVV